MWDVQRPGTCVRDINALNTYDRDDTQRRWLVKKLVVVSWVVFVYGSLAYAETFTDLQYFNCTDGDTCTFTIPNIPRVFGQQVRIRVANIDTPELDATCDTPQQTAYVQGIAKDAQDELHTILDCARFIAVKHATRDKYKRIEATVLADGKDVGTLLIDKGLAKPWPQGRGPRPTWCE